MGSDRSDRSDRYVQGEVVTYRYVRVLQVGTLKYLEKIINYHVIPLLLLYHVITFPIRQLFIHCLYNLLRL
ncbi:hypothetical protein L249_8343 [Ophiocordyceps polyrhachis-furcata BCC 54312]|uniref:Uncharacterized protein n=1 Tax=Ophiocordyceps polyrhachis-furcata BCC 54312 TaxID=1330021 RepID=A0A367L1J9_9HYPO|nr:hypothetical protein L249_8343 [Ophiocordyceps polyrhachis-furcata BCC 54312]